MDWEDYFPTAIAERGYDYYSKGYVTDLKQTETQITATVTGTQDYCVVIDLANGDFQDGTCECPYANSHPYCKHMAAVLYQATAADKPASQHQVSKAPTDNDNHEQTATKLVERATDRQVRDFLSVVLAHDNHLLKMFRTVIGETNVVTDLPNYLASVDDLFDSNADAGGFIDYGAATDFGDETLTFLNEEVQPLVDQGEYGLVFQILAHLMLKIDHVDIDDSDGETMMIVNASVDLWEAVLTKADADLQQQVFDWLCKQLAKPLNIIEDTLDDLLFTYFKTPAFIDAKLAYTAKRFRAVQKHPDSWNYDWQTEKWLKHYLQMMTAAHMPDKQVIEFCKANLATPQVRLFYSQFCLQHHDEAHAVQLLKDGKTLVTDNRRMLAEFSRQLKGAYQQLGEQQLYRQELWQLLTEYAPADEALFSELKQSYPTKDWPAVREQLLTAIAKNSNVDLKPLYVQEKLLDRLLKAVVAADGLWDLQTYESLLKPHFSNQLLAKYDHEVRKMATATGTRRKYQQLVRILKRMLDYPDGKSIVQTIVHDWQQQYPRRSAMMDELSRLKL
ncbi:SWIM zinc finger family protein [Lactiplantibacillus pentosus]|uniref:SWIM zinc finger family protein n=1 Tax=Lactiplantibacillus pentosus TaxID=1589 RepID=UPI001CFF6F56|nr:SWIM zinc finger family protein [Lactiplantibacillus pentosus]MCB5221427.1 SWIM zinc finger family protein [Lactiplantibacillus pentosus]MCS8604851.1 hypothetical protein [Lactiplantibacillus pentosus]